MKSFTESLDQYQIEIQKGDIRIAYKGLIDYMAGLKNYFRIRYPEFSVPGNLYQGYMDMTYFSLCPDFFKERKLKIAIVLIHYPLKFEIWLSGFNKQIQSGYWNTFRTEDLKEYRMPLNIKGSDSIVEYTLAEKPDFGDHDILTSQIESGVLKFIKDMEVLIKNHKS